METGRALAAARGASDKDGCQTHDVVPSSRAGPVPGVTESAIPLGKDATSSTAHRWVITAPFGAAREPGLVAFAPNGNLNQQDK